MLLAEVALAISDRLPPGPHMERVHDFLARVSAASMAAVTTEALRSLRWARSKPWRYAAVPGAAAAIVVFALTVLHGSGIGGAAFTALWHGGLTYGLTGAVGATVRPRGKNASV